MEMTGNGIDIDQVNQNLDVDKTQDMLNGSNDIDGATHRSRKNNIIQSGPEASELGAICIRFELGVSRRPSV